MRELDPPFPPELLALRTVAAARVDNDGRLVQGNAGFYALYPPALQAAERPYVASAFIQPAFADLIRHPPTGEQPAYAGIITLGDRTGVTHSLRGEVSRHAGGIRVIAEHDIDELEKLYERSIEQGSELAEMQRKLTTINRLLQEMSVTDPLTRVGNRRRLDQRFDEEIARATRQGSPLSVAICDIDHFKHYNDTYGHEVGDLVLAGAAQLMERQVRPTDLIARFGGEEFVILMPQTTGADAMAGSERIRAALAAKPVEGTPEPVTASFGVAEWLPGESAAETLERADRALYKAKAGGRNRVRLAEVVDRTSGQPGNAAS